MANLADVVQQLKETNDTQDVNLVQNALQLDDLREINEGIAKDIKNMLSTMEQVRNNIIRSVEVQKNIFEMQTGQKYAEREAQLEAERKAIGDSDGAGGAVEDSTPTSDDKQKGGMLGKLFGIMAGVGLIAALTASEEQLKAFGTFIKEKVVPGFKQLYEEASDEKITHEELIEKSELYKAFTRKLFNSPDKTDELMDEQRKEYVELLKEAFEKITQD